MNSSDTAASLTGFATWWRRLADRGGFSSTALSALDTLDRHGPQRISDLAVRERLTQPGMTGLATRLADEGLVERLPDPHDGRVTRVALTPTGRAHIDALRQARAEHLASLVEQLAPADQRLLAAAAPALSRLAAIATEGIAA